MRMPALTLAILAAVALSSCARGPEPEAATNTDDAALSDAGTTTAAGDAPAMVTMRYSCPEGYEVALMGDAARVTTGDGQTIALSRVAGSAPPLYSGEALQFAVGTEDAQLARDGGGQWSCRPE